MDVPARKGDERHLPQAKKNATRTRTWRSGVQVCLVSGDYPAYCEVSTPGRGTGGVRPRSGPEHRRCGAVGGIAGHRGLRQIFSAYHCGRVCLGEPLQAVKGSLQLISIAATRLSCTTAAPAEVGGCVSLLTPTTAAPTVLFWGPQGLWWAGGAALACVGAAGGISFSSALFACV